MKASAKHDENFDDDNLDLEIVSDMLKYEKMKAEQTSLIIGLNSKQFLTIQG